MSYIGSTPTTQSFIAGTDTFSGTGAQTAYTLTRAVNSVNDILVVVNNVDQQPTAYTISGTTLTFSAAPSSGTNNIYVRYLSTTLQSITVPGGTTVDGSFGIADNLNFIGTGNRITGDFSNATVANRVMFQTSTVNGASRVGILPNGTSPAAELILWNNSDTTNAGIGSIRMNQIDFAITSTYNGSGTYLPMTFYTGGSERARIATNGDFQFNSGYGSVATAYGCRAWVNFNGTGTVAIRASGNVSSITDNGVGDYTVNFTTAMPDANYNAVTTCSRTVEGGMQRVSSLANITTSGYRFNTMNGNGGTAIDSDPVFVSIFR